MTLINMIFNFIQSGRIPFIIINIVIMFIMIAIIFYVLYLFFKFIYASLRKKNENDLFKEHQCVMLDSPWGTGKTYYYDNKIKKKLNSPIYISCFSYTILELLTEIAIKNSFIIRAISFNGLFFNFMKNNWSLLIPKNRIIVLDDLERLHQNDENILDIISLIDRLLKNNNKILLIGHLDKILKNSKIASEYLEKVVDNFIPFDKSSFLNSVLKEFFNKNQCSNENKQYINNVIERSTAVEYLLHSKLNLRIVKKFLPILLESYKEIEEKHKDYGEVVKEYINEKLLYLIQQRYKYFIDINKFNEKFDEKNQRFGDITKEDIKYFNTSKIQKIDKQSLINYLLYDFSHKIYIENIGKIISDNTQDNNLIYNNSEKNILNIKDKYLKNFTEEETEKVLKELNKQNEYILNYLEKILNDNNEKFDGRIYNINMFKESNAFLREYLRYLVNKDNEINLKNFVKFFMIEYANKYKEGDLISFLGKLKSDFYPIDSIIFDKEKYDEFEKIFNEISNSNDEALNNKKHIVYWDV